MIIANCFQLDSVNGFTILQQSYQQILILHLSTNQVIRSKGQELKRLIRRQISQRLKTRINKWIIFKDHYQPRKLTKIRKWLWTSSKDRVWKNVYKTWKKNHQDVSRTKNGTWVLKIYLQFLSISSQKNIHWAKSRNSFEIFRQCQKRIGNYSRKCSLMILTVS